MSPLSSNVGPKHCRVCSDVITEQFDSYVDTCGKCLGDHSKVLTKADGVWKWEETVE
ncbi:protein YhfH [Bacillus horti]|uniref:Nucleic acid-binding Zn ribbon protein n=1 Tax=Caldalkalibacillus horti TaxID=77523 RepID=A0ABT9VW75_9BACI|nr:protein YhfH [Bacillus horti]MDQ0165236.1 putative nucleic acid-binding Zn ribbon protein [Bacillus horti]